MKTLLPLQPEAMVDMQARFAHAIAEPFDCDHLRLGSCLPPFFSRRHTFDLSSGLRLCSFRVRHARVNQWVAVIASLASGSMLRAEADAGRLDPDTYQWMALEFFDLISRDPRPACNVNLNAEAQICSWRVYDEFELAGEGHASGTDD